MSFTHNRLFNTSVSPNDRLDLVHQSTHHYLSIGARQYVVSKSSGIDRNPPPHHQPLHPQSRRRRHSSVRQGQSGRALRDSYKLCTHSSLQHYSKMDAKTLLKPLYDIASCPVCFERLRPPSTCCVNGHAVCAKCGGELSQCPTCQGRFLEGKNTMFDKFLEALPVLCKHKGCTEDTKDDPDHEKWCGFRDTRCREGYTGGGWCEWTGPVSQLRQHVEQEHKLWSSIDEYNNECDGVDLSADDWSRTDAVVEHGHVFWITWKRMGSNKTLSYQIVMVPNGRICGDRFQFKVEFKNEQRYLLSSTTVLFDSDNDCLTFNFDTLKPYTVKGEVHPKCYILKE